jgi:Tol biopolymer transport system component
MTSRLLRVLAALLMYAVVGISLPGRASAAPEERVAASKVQDRLLWAESGPGLRNLHIRSSRVDGTGVRRVYDNSRGFTMVLVPSPNGRRVAFVTCCRGDLPLLVVAPTKGGPHLEPLKDHPELEAADGIGWSPDGTRLAFRAVVQEGEQQVASIWTIRTDGTDLQHVLALGDVCADSGGPGTDDTMVWTDDGILYTAAGELRLASDGTSTLVMSRVRGVRTTGDGQRLLLRRVTGLKQQVWLARRDGTRPRKLLQWDLDGSRWMYLEVVPNRDGSRLLAHRLDLRDVGGREGWIAWDTAKGPRSSEPLPVRDDASAVTFY